MIEATNLGGDDNGDVDPDCIARFKHLWIEGLTEDD